MDFLLEAALEEEAVVAVDSNALVTNKVECFNKELSYIKNERIKSSAITLINLIPEYFFHEAASSTGKYHPDFSQGEGGLLRHTKAAVRIAKEILDTETFGNDFDLLEKDLIILSLIMHDSVKRGDNENHTRFDHPLLASKLIFDNQDKTSLTKEELKLLKKMIESHMGQWNISTYSDVVLPKPEDKYEKLVHLCDLLSSKKFLNIKFDENNNISF